MKQPWIVGIVGGVASGKSEVTRQLQQHGAVVVHADEIGHRVLLEEPVREALLAYFGSGILDPKDGTVDRSRLAAMVFGSDPIALAKRQKLESIVHPRIRLAIHAEIDSAIASEQTWLIVLDVPLLIESGWIDHCDRVIMVEADENTRWKRAQTRGWTEQAFRDREASQLPISEKRAAATDSIDNSGSLAALRAEVDELIARYQRLRSESLG